MENIILQIIKICMSVMPADNLSYTIYTKSLRMEIESFLKDPIIELIIEEYELNNEIKEYIIKETNQFIDDDFFISIFIRILSYTSSEIEIYMKIATSYRVDDIIIDLTDMSTHNRRRITNGIFNIFDKYMNQEEINLKLEEFTLYII
jgi:hypothetical protein